MNDFKQAKVNREFLADVFKCEVRTVQNYAQLNGLPRDERGEYPLFDCLLWFINKLQKDYNELLKDNPLTRARIEAIELNNQKKKIEMERDAGKLVEADKVKFLFVAAIKPLMMNLESITPRLNKKINGDSKTLSIIRDEIREYRNFVFKTPIPDVLEDAKQMMTDGRCVDLEKL